jgi:hypothetical protein
MAALSTNLEEFNFVSTKGGWNNAGNNFLKLPQMSN